MEHDPKRLSVVANVIGYSMFSRDGREISMHEESGQPMIMLTEAERVLVTEVAARVLDHLEIFDSRSS